jgi:hypothetical protein
MKPTLDWRWRKPRNAEGYPINLPVLRSKAAMFLAGLISKFAGRTRSSSRILKSLPDVHCKQPPG